MTQTLTKAARVTRDDICAALERALVVNPGALQDDDSFIGEDAVDSLTLQLVVLELEDLTGLFLNVADVAKCRTVTDLYTLIHAQDV